MREKEKYIMCPACGTFNFTEHLYCRGCNQLMDAGEPRADDRDKKRLENIVSLPSRVRKMVKRRAV